MKKMALLLGLFAFLVFMGTAKADIYSNWSYRQNFTISYNGSYGLNAYQVKMLLNSSIFNYSHANTDGSDIRIAYNEDEMPVCMKNWTLNSLSEIWTKMNITANSSVDITLYFGNTNATSVSNCSNVFDFYENWSGYGNNTNVSATGRWSWLGSYSYSGICIPHPSCEDEHTPIWCEEHCGSLYNQYDCENYYEPNTCRWYEEEIGNPEPQIICEGGICYLYSKSNVPYGSNLVQTASNFSVSNFSLTMKYTMATETNNDGGTSLYYKNSNFSVCNYSSTYPCGQLIFNHNYYDNINILYINSTAWITVATDSNTNYNENTNPNQIRELQGEGNNLTAIFKKWNGSTIGVLNGFDSKSGLTNNIPSLISIDQKYRYNKYYEIYLRKFTYNEPAVQFNQPAAVTLNLTFVSPTPNNGTTINSTSFTANVSSNGTVSSCTFTLDGTNYSMTIASGNLSASKSNSALSQGIHRYNATCDGFMTETRTLSVDSIAPTIIIYSPANTSYVTTSIALQVSANEPISTWWYKLNGGTNTTFTPNTTISAIQGSNNIIIYANDSVGNIGSSAVSFFVDSVAPIITIYSPQSTTYNVADIALQVSSGTEAVNTWWYRLNSGLNITFIPNITISAAEGINTIYVYGNDSSNNIASSAVTFTLSTPEGQYNRSLTRYLLMMLPLLIAVIIIMLMLRRLDEGTLDLESLLAMSVSVIVMIALTVVLSMVI